MIHFPKPIRFGSAMTRWRLSDLERYEAECAGRPEPPSRAPQAERYLSVRQVATRYSASTPTIWRWCREWEIG